MRDDSTHHAWRKIAADQATETAAENIIKGMLGISI